jgi:hypothetical protein
MIAALVAVKLARNDIAAPHTAGVTVSAIPFENTAEGILTRSSGGSL